MTNLAIRPKTTNERQLQDYLDHLDRETANRHMQRLGEVFGFPTTEAEGEIWTTRGYLWILLDYRQESGFRNLLREHRIPSRPLAGFAQKVRIAIRQDLGLPESDVRTSLLNYRGLLLAARHSKSKMADRIMDYVFAQEGWARREQAVQRETGRSTAQLRAYATGQAVPVRLIAVEAVGLPVFDLPGRGQTVCITAIERVTDKRRGTIRDQMRHDDDLLAAYDVISGRELQPLKATGWLSKSASSAAVLPFEVSLRWAERAGRLGRILVEMAREALAGRGPQAALPGGR